MKAKFDIGRNILRPITQRATRQLFYQAVDNVETQRACAEHMDLWEAMMRGELSHDDYEQKRKEVKKRLWFATYQATFSDHYKHNQTAEPSGLTFFDIDHIDAAATADDGSLWARLLKSMHTRQPIGDEATRQELQQLGVVLVELSASAQGMHIVFATPVGMTNQQAQEWLSHELGGIDYDRGTHELARATYMVPRQYILYIDEPCLFGESEIAPVAPPSSPEGDTIAPTSANKTIEAPSGAVGGASSGDERGAVGALMARRAFDLCMEKAQVTESMLNTLGTCHNTLKMLLPDLGQLMTASQLMAVLEERVPDYASCEDCRRLVADFYQKYIDPNRPMTVAQKEIFRRLMKAGNHDQGTTADRISIHSVLGPRPQPLPQRLPSLIRLLISREPRLYHPTVANAVFPALGAHFVGVKFPYIDNTLREATFMCCTMAPMSSGKSCVDRPVECILEDIRQRDQLNINRENEWKQQCKTRGANKEKPRRPEGLCIQVMESDMTNAAFVQKLVDADGKYLYTIVDEVELFSQLKTNGTRSVGKIFRLAFDNKPYGQVRVGVDSVSGSMPLRWNWNASTTIQQGQKFFRTMKADGTLSRINFTTILTERGQDIPVHGTYDDDFRAQLKPYIDRLNAASGTIDCPQAHRLARRMLKESAQIADVSDDEIYERLSFRAVVIAWLKAMTLYVAEGQWSKTIEDFAVWSMNYDMWCKMQFFGEEMREQMIGEQLQNKPGPQNLLVQLPEVFTKDDVERVRIQNGRNRDATAMLRVWKNRGYIVFDEQHQQYAKAKGKRTVRTDNS